MVHDPTPEEPKCSCGNAPAFLVIETGPAERDWQGRRVSKRSEYSCGRCLPKVVRTAKHGSAIVRVIS